MKNLAKHAINSLFNAVGLQVVSLKHSSLENQLPVEFTEAEQAIYQFVRQNELSMVAPSGLWATMLACKHILAHDIPGDFVECGVWRGGTAILAAAILQQHGSNRKVYLYDTFAGMSQPEDNDINLDNGKPAAQLYQANKKATHNAWCYASLEDVKNNFVKAGLSLDNLVFVKGDVLQTLQQTKDLPKQISLLRLDTDWYQSTLLELEVLYPKLSVGGILAVDDYGAWSGSKQATDEYFTRHPKPFLQRTDMSGRMGLKVTK